MKVTGAQRRCIQFHLEALDRFGKAAENHHIPIVSDVINFLND